MSTRTELTTHRYGATLSLFATAADGRERCLFWTQSYASPAFGTARPRYTKYVKITVSKTAVDVQDFGVVDNKGRAVAARCTSLTETWEPATEADKKAQTSYYCHEGSHFAEVYDDGEYAGDTGTLYRMDVRALRAGEGFGPAFASSDRITYTTTEARDAAVAKYFKGSRARAVKAWGVK